jgi:hypothetical protein
MKFEVSVSKGWIAANTDIRIDREYYFDPLYRYEIDRQCHQAVNEKLGEFGAFYTESNLGRTEFFKENQVLVGGIQPNMIIGMLLGADFLPASDRDADISPACWMNKDVADLPSPESLLDHDLIKLFDKQITELRATGKYEVIPPFFWDNSGRAAIHGALTTAHKFLGEEVFLAILDESEDVHVMEEWITNVNILLTKHFAEIAGMPVKQVHVGECSSCMVGPDVFDEFVVKYVSKIGRELAPVRLHLCGASNQNLERCKGIENLYNLDLGGENSVAAVRKHFGLDFAVSIAPLVNDFSAATAEPLLNWAEKVIIDNAGGDLTILYHLESNYSLDNIRALHQKVTAIQ